MLTTAAGDDERRRTCPACLVNVLEATGLDTAAAALAVAQPHLLTWQVPSQRSWLQQRDLAQRGAHKQVQREFCIVSSLILSLGAEQMYLSWEYGGEGKQVGIEYISYVAMGT